MPNINKWHTRAICPKCGWHVYAPFGSVFHVHTSCCPECGYEKYDGHRLSRLYRTAQEWEVKTMRWVTAAKLMKPSTWGTGNWETLNAGNADQGRTDRFSC